MLTAAFLLGFAGSLHCLVMCSPLAMAATNVNSSFFLKRVTYNAGRIFTYGILGFLMSSVGELFQMTKLQNILSISLGVVMVLAGITGFGMTRVPFLTKPMAAFQVAIKKLFSSFLGSKNIFSTALLGMLNGLLPCGLTFIALTYCIILPTSADGFIFMIVFGAGTLPVMLGFTSVASLVIKHLNVNLKGITAIAMIGIGSLLISRTILNLHDNRVAAKSNESIIICR